MSRGLLAHILKHAKEEGWVQDGSIVLDCFGGIFTTGILGAYENLNVIGIELEERFVRLANENINLHAHKLKALGCPIPVILQGDSRKLCEVIEKADIVVSSPPYAESMEHKGGIDPAKSAHSYGPHSQMNRSDTRYGQTPGNLAATKPGQIDAVISSPPFLENNVNIGAVGDTPGKRQQIHDSKPRKESYGATSGQLGNLKPGNVDAIVPSPPYEGIEIAAGTATQASIKDRKKRRADKDWEGYNKQNPDNLGSNKGDTFWQAALEIVQQCHQILKPGGHAIWVVKAFVRKGKRVDFPGDWRRLCESVGLKTVCVHHAMLLRETRDDGLFGEMLDRKHRRSFFKNLSETKAAWKKYWETLTEETQAVWLKKVGGKAHEKAFEASGEDEYDWNAHVRIDYEVVICGVKE